ncbi:MAG: hypothetical protein WC773_03835 [Patescibacteria group bacterium]|jgi:hypothetical protein
MKAFGKVVLAFALVLALLLPSACFAQAPTTTPKVAVLPWVFTENGRATNSTKSSAVTTVEKMVVDLLAKVGLERVDDGKVTGVWSRDLGKELPTGAAFPDDRDLLALGQKLDVDYVMVGNCAWRVRSVWVGFGPKTKAECEVSVRVIDVKAGVVDYKTVANSDSTKKEDPLAIAGTLLITPIFTFVSGGPKTPHMQRSGGFATAKAVGGWATKFATTGQKIKIDDKK